MRTLLLNNRTHWEGGPAAGKEGEERGSTSKRERSRRFWTVIASIAVALALIAVVAFYQSTLQPPLRVVTGRNTVTASGDFINASSNGVGGPMVLIPPYNVTTQIFQAGHPTSLFSMRLLQGNIFPSSLYGPSTTTIDFIFLMWINGSLSSNLHPNGIGMNMNDSGYNDSKFSGGFEGNVSAAGSGFGLNPTNTSYVPSSNWSFSGNSSAQALIQLLYPNQLTSDSSAQKDSLYNFGITIEIQCLLLDPVVNVTSLDHVLHIQLTMDGLSKPASVYSTLYFNDTTGW